VCERERERERDTAVPYPSAVCARKWV